MERASRRTRAGRCATGQQQGRCGLCGWCGLCFGGAQHSSLPSDEPSHPISDEITHASGVPAHPHVPAHLSVVRIIVTPPRETSGGVSVQPAGVPSSTRDPQPEADSPDDRARTHSVVSAASSLNSKGTVPSSWLSSKFLLAAAAKSVLSTVLPPPLPQSMVPHRGALTRSPAP